MAVQQRNMNKVTEANNNGYQDTDTLLKKPAKKLILNWNEIPTWMQDNGYITDGYRHQTNSYVECVKSLGYLHNESGKVMDKIAKYKGQGN
jgi:adiponectin receptor